MGEISKISWTDGTFNIAWGCTEVGPGCDSCYAREHAARFGWKWGHGAERRYFSDKHWNDPIRWNKKAEKAGKRMKVFCSSMADIFDNEIDQGVRDRLWTLIDETPWIDWQLLTKRIGNAPSMFPSRWLERGAPPSVWLGITVVNQEEVDRDLSKLARFVGRFKILWLSIEPQLGDIDLATWLFSMMSDKQCAINWVVDGGESDASHARQFKLEWARSLRDQCAAAGVAFFMKQLGSNPFPRGDGWINMHRSYKWDEPERWPDDLKIQEFPK